jgi:hypothetical protein
MLGHGAHSRESGFMSYADSGSLGKFCYARRLDHSEPWEPSIQADFPASYRDGTAIGGAQFRRPDNMQSSWREMSISFINKK